MPNGDLGATDLVQGVLGWPVLAVRAVVHQGVAAGISDSVVVTRRRRAGIALGVDLFGLPARACQVEPGHGRSEWLHTTGLCTAVRAVVGRAWVEGTRKPGPGELRSLFGAV